jgi:hypothetical protein
MTPEIMRQYLAAHAPELETVDDWIARVKARGHAMLEEKQLKYRIERYGNIAHLWSSYALQSDGKQVARGINGHHGAGRVGHCPAAQGIFAVK